MRRSARNVALVVILLGSVIVVFGLTRPPPKAIVKASSAPAPSVEEREVSAPVVVVRASAAPQVSRAPLIDEQEEPASEELYMRELMQLRRTDPRRALALAKKGDDWYPGTGRPAEARKAMVVTLLVDLGNMEEARDLTRRFIAAYPNSEYRPLVQGVTGIHPRPHGPDNIEY